MPAKKTDRRDEAFLRALGGFQKAKRVTNCNLAERINVARSTLANWNRKPGNMTLEHFRILAREAQFTDEDIIKTVRHVP